MKSKIKYCEKKHIGMYIIMYVLQRPDQLANTYLPILEIFA